MAKTGKSKNRGRQTRGRGPAALKLPPGYSAQTFIRVRDNGQLAPTAVDGGLGWSFKLNDVPDYAEFTSLYDAYVLDKVELTYILENNTPGQYPVLFWAPDYDDASTPLTVDTVTTHQNVKMHAFSENARSVTMTVRPRTLGQTYRAGVTSGYNWQPEGTLIDMANTDVPYYGIKAWMSHNNFTDNPYARVRSVIKYHLRFVGQR